MNQKFPDLIDTASATLNTSNELATALNDDSNFATTLATSIATKRPHLKSTGRAGSTIFNNYDNSIRQIYSI